jgi:hypothetical protein
VKGEPAIGLRAAYTELPEIQSEVTVAGIGPNRGETGLAPRKGLQGLVRASGFVTVKYLSRCCSDGGGQLAGFPHFHREGAGVVDDTVANRLGVRAGSEQYEGGENKGLGGAMGQVHAIRIARHGRYGETGL